MISKIQNMKLVWFRTNDGQHKKRRREVNRKIMRWIMTTVKVSTLRIPATKEKGIDIQSSMQLKHWFEALTYAGWANSQLTKLRIYLIKSNNIRAENYIGFRAALHVIESVWSHFASQLLAHSSSSYIRVDHTSRCRGKDHKQVP